MPSPVLIDAIVVVFAIIMSNIGARYIIMDVQKRHEKLFAHPHMRYLYIFCMAYLGARNMYIAAGAAVAYAVLL